MEEGDKEEREREREREMVGEGHKHRLRILPLVKKRGLILKRALRRKS